VKWMLALQRVVVGTGGLEFDVKSSYLDEPLTPTDFLIKPISTVGSANVAAAKIDARGVYVARGGARLMELGTGDQSMAYGYGHYSVTDLSIYYPTIGSPGFTRLAVQRHLDTRIHCVRSDGTVAVLIYFPSEEINCWINIEMANDGVVEDIVIVPGGDNVEDTVYYLVRRVINGSTVRYLEKWALETDCQGGSLSCQSDAHYRYSGSSTSTISGLDHLIGETVCIWGDGKDLGTAVVNGSGQVSLSTAVTNACVGIPYTAQWQSTKLVYALESLNRRNRVNHLGAVLYNTHYQGLTYGMDFDHLDPLPLTSQGTTIAADTIFETYDEQRIEFDGTWDGDARICLQAASPRPCTVLAIDFPVENANV